MAPAIGLVLVILIIYSSIMFEIGAKVCPGFCVPRELCEGDGGKVLGVCVNQRVCCDVSHKLNRSTCGTVVSFWDSSTPAEFVSPDFPGHSSGNLICQFELKLNRNIVGIKLEFVKFELEDGKSVVFQEVTKDIRCDADMFFIKGFSDWMTNPLCGNLNEYSVLIDLDRKDSSVRKLILLFIASSAEFRWKIKIHQILPHKVKKSELCLQSRFKKFSNDPNFPRTIQIVENQKQLNLLNLENLPRWKWDVDIVSKTGGSNLLTSRCPQRNNPNDTADNNDYPNFHRKLCSGTILDERHILTTGSCFLNSKIPLKHIKILTTGFCPTNHHNPKLGEHHYSIEDVFLHFNFISSINLNDLAVVRTRKPIKFTESVQPLSIFSEKISNLLSFLPSKSASDPPTATAVEAEGLENKCSTNQTNDENTTPNVLKQYLSSSKYQGLLHNWICVPGLLSVHYNECPDNLDLLAGASIIGIDQATGNLSLQGIFSHILLKEKHIQRINFSSSNDEDMNISNFGANFYFTKTEAFRKWLLMALS